MADFGPKIALKICDGIREDIKDNKIKSGDDLYSELKSSVFNLLKEKCPTTSSILNLTKDTKPCKFKS